MPQYHPRYKEWIIGTWDLVWKDINGAPTIDATQRASRDAVGNLVNSETPDSRPTPAIGWKINLTKLDGTQWLDHNGQPGWSTYAKHPDIKPIFTGYDYPLGFPKVAATLRNIRSKAVPLSEKKPEEITQILASEPEKLWTYLLTNILHSLEKWLKKGFGFWTYSPTSDIGLEVIKYVGGESRPWIRITKWNDIYTLFLSQPYCRDAWRHAWSLYIDTSDSKDSRHKDSSAQNFKLLPVWDSYFEAKICLDTENYTPLSWQNIQLLKSIDQLLQSLERQ